MDFHINLECFTDIPDPSTRIEKENAVYQLLSKLDIPFLRADHDPAFTGELCGAIEDLLDVKVCKNLFLCTSKKKDYYLLMLPIEKRFVSKNVSKLLGSSRLSFASSEDMEEILGLTPGSVSIFGLMNDSDHRVKLVIDSEIAQSDYAGCHPNINTSTLKVSVSDLINKYLPYLGYEPIILDLNSIPDETTTVKTN